MALDRDDRAGAWRRALAAARAAWAELRGRDRDGSPDGRQAGAGWEDRVRARTADLQSANEALRLEEQRYRSLVEATAAIVWNTPASGEFEVEQPRWSAFTGQSFEELKGWGWLNAVHPDDRPGTAAAWSAAVAGQTLYQVEHRLRRHDGTYRHMMVRAVPIVNEAGAIREWVGVHTDVTLQKEAEADLHKTRELAESASRAKSEFLANMSHEIRTPMNGILGMIDLALDTRLTSDQRLYLEQVKSSAEALMTVINDILDFSKIEAGKFDLDAIPFSLRDRLGDALKTLALRAHRQGLELACDIDADIPDRLIGDPGRLGQVVLNLVGNAIKFTELGEVVLSVRPIAAAGPPATGVPGEPDPAQPSALPGDAGAGGRRVGLEFAVRDTGIGIPEDRQARLFQPFTQADSSTTRQFGGSGLGLSISQRLVAMMGGRIWFESVPGQGSTFHFTAWLGVDESPDRPAPIEPLDVRGVPVLVVDDNATNRTILRETLARWGMIPTVADSALAALAELSAAASSGAPIPLVITDAMMPGIDGFQLAEQIGRRRELARPAVILLSSAGLKDDARRRRAGLSACLIKPIKQSELLDTVITALHGLEGARVPSGAPSENRDGLERGPDRRREVANRPANIAAPAPDGSLRVLLAEDNATNRLLAVTLLEKAGHSVDTAANGQEALDALETRPFDVVLMDVQMPEMDGFEATARIRALERERADGRHIPIVAMTAHAMKGDRERCLSAGMDDYIAKPIRSDELRRVLSSLVRTGLPRGHEAAAPGAAPAEPLTTPAKTTSRDDSDRVNRAALLARVGGRDDRMRTIVRLFLDESNKMMAEIRDAIAAGDTERLMRSAHSFKGAAALFGDDEVTGAAQELESLGRNGVLAGTTEIRDRLEVTLARLRRALTAILETTPAG